MLLSMREKQATCRHAVQDGVNPICGYGWSMRYGKPCTGCMDKLHNGYEPKERSKCVECEGGYCEDECGVKMYEPKEGEQDE